MGHRGVALGHEGRNSLRGSHVALGIESYQQQMKDEEYKFKKRFRVHLWVLLVGTHLLVLC